MVIIMIGLFILTVSGIVAMNKASYSSAWEIVGIVTTLIAGVSLVIALVALPIEYYGSKSEVDRYHALKETIENSRSGDVSDIERAALVNEIAKYNQKLASAKYWNNTIFDIYIYDGLAELDYLE